MIRFPSLANCSRAPPDSAAPMNRTECVAYEPSLNGARAKRPMTVISEEECGRSHAFQHRATPCRPLKAVRKLSSVTKAMNSIMHSIMGIPLEADGDSLLM